MSKDLLIRDLAPEDVDWLNAARPTGVSQNEFLKSILADARTSLRHPELFDVVMEPKTVYSSAPFKFIDLFAGIGGFRSAMTALGGKCVYTNEWDKYACRTYQAWYGDHEIDSRDIGTVDIANDIPDHDVLCAGFPCQPFFACRRVKENLAGPPSWLRR